MSQNLMSTETGGEQTQYHFPGLREPPEILKMTYAIAGTKPQQQRISHIKRPLVSSGMPQRILRMPIHQQILLKPLIRRKEARRREMV